MAESKPPPDGVPPPLRPVETIAFSSTPFPASFPLTANHCSGRLPSPAPRREMSLLPRMCSRSLGDASGGPHDTVLPQQDGAISRRSGSRQSSPGGDCTENTDAPPSISSDGACGAPSHTSVGSATVDQRAMAHSEVSTTAKVLVFDNTKAGLQFVDKEKTEALLTELSKNSSFFTNEERKAQRRQQQIEKLLVQSRYYEASVRSRSDVFRQLKRDIADLEENLEAQRSFDSIYVHMDMDMFYAAVETKKNPQYAHLPLGVGTTSMLSTTNYVARRYGVRSGMPGFLGLRLCPQLIIVPTDFAAYRAESAVFKRVVREYDPGAEGLGMDEIMMRLDDHLAQQYMHATTLVERFDVAERVVEECRRRITEETGLTASAGIAVTPTLAKMASNYKKPNGQSSVRLFSREAVMDFLSNIPVRQVPGIGKSTESILAGLGIHTLGEVYAQRHRLCYILTRKTFLFLLASAMGVGGMYDALQASTERGESSIAADGSRNDDEEDELPRKSVGQERTFSQLTSAAELQFIAHKNLRCARMTLVKEGLLASQVVLKLKYRDFHVKQHTKTLNVCTDDPTILARALDEVLLPLLEGFADYRLLGVRLEKLRRRLAQEGSADGSSMTLTLTGSGGNEVSTQLTLRDLFTRQRSAGKVLSEPPSKCARTKEIISLDSDDGDDAVWTDMDSVVPLESPARTSGDGEDDVLEVCAPRTPFRDRPQQREEHVDHSVKCTAEGEEVPRQSSGSGIDDVVIVE